MKVSLITVVLNGVDVLGTALHSVATQSYPHIEHIIIDGGSTDGTLDLVASYGSKISTLLSEPDRGLYDAMNKGLALATGDIIGILNADDLLAHPHVIKNIVDKMTATGADSLYADLTYVAKDAPDQVVRYWKSGPFKRSSFKYGWMPPHPTFYVKRHVYNQFGVFDTQFKSAADYELMLRLLYKQGISTCYLPEVTVRMRVGGKSNASLLNRLLANQEDQAAWKANGLNMPFYTPYLKPLRKVGQFFKNA